MRHACHEWRVRMHGKWQSHVLHAVLKRIGADPNLQVMRRRADGRKAFKAALITWSIREQSAWTAGCTWN